MMDDVSTPLTPPKDEISMDQFPDRYSQNDNDENQQQGQEIQLDLRIAESGIAVDELGRATEIKIFDCRSIQMRVFHMTWITFFLCFFAWFGTANVYKWIQADLNLTPIDRANAGAAAVSSTILFRLFVGWACDRIGPRYTYSILLFCSSIPVLAAGIVTNATGYVVVHFFIGLAGASFVITQYHTIAMFAPNVIGTATATTAGWGNLGGGVTNLVMPIFTLLIEKEGRVPPNLSWRYTMIIPGSLILLNGFLYLMCTKDTPHGNKYSGCTLNDSTTTDDEPDWENVGGRFDRAMTLSTVPREEHENAFLLGAKDYRAWILHLCYACCFGVELTVLRFSAGHFRHQFGVSPAIAGLLVIFFSIPNLFARTWGGIAADKMSLTRGVAGRVRTLFICLIGEGLMLIVFSLMSFSIVLTVVALVGFSIFVQMAEGAAMSIVPFVNPKAVGAVAGIVGAGGNVGGGLFAMALFRFVPTRVSYPNAFAMMGGIVLVVSFVTFSLNGFDGDDEKRSQLAAAQRAKSASPRRPHVQVGQSSVGHFSSSRVV